MADPILNKDLLISDDEINRHLAEAFGESVDNWIDQEDVAPSATARDSILTARVIDIRGNTVVVEAGLKSEGMLPISEWDDPAAVKIGDKIQVHFDEIDPETGEVLISKRRADRQINWARLLETAKEGDRVKGRVSRSVRGGLLLDIGVNAFMPASQVDIRRPGNIDAFIDRELEAEIVSIDRDRQNIVVSRRTMLERERDTAKATLMKEIEVGQTRKGVVKNLASFGAFIDLGGLDGLLHITDLAWERINHPSQVLKVDQAIEVMILKIDFEKEKVALGLKQLQENPWTRVLEKYPVGSRITGEVVSLMNYGAFVRIEPGVEGLVHVSDMSWTQRVNHPQDVVTVGAQIEAIVLEIDVEKQNVSLGIKQTEANPWTTISQKYPPGTLVEGEVRNMTNFGAFIEIEPGIDGLLHVNDMSWTRKVGHPSEAVEKGARIKCVVMSTDAEKMRIALGLKQLNEDPWENAIPTRYVPGMVVRGKVSKITNFGAFVELEDHLEGLLHISEIADHEVTSPEDELKLGEEVEVKILRVDAVDRKIGLSKKRADWSGDADTDAADQPARRERKLRGGLGDGADAAGIGA